ncbi:hypothetical protein ACWDRB_50430 [Nonomuraea sp. NPDC003707]
MLRRSEIGATIEYHRSQIRTHLGFRTCTMLDATKLALWLAENVKEAVLRTGGIVLSLAEVSGTSCEASQCSMIFPSLIRNTSMTARPHSPGVST